MSEKECLICRVHKPISEFTVDRSQPSGICRFCKPCIKAKNAASYQRNLAKRREAMRNWRQANAEKVRAAGKVWREANAEKHRENARRWYENNLERGRANVSKYAAANKDRARVAQKLRYATNKEKLRAENKAWCAANPHLVTAMKARRRAAKLQRTPGWLTAEDKKAIQFIYEMARVLSDATGIPRHVDHEIPLQGELVSGLHVPSNLQVITASENTSKSNRWVPE